MPACVLIATGQCISAMLVQMGKRSTCSNSSGDFLEFSYLQGKTMTQTGV
jgi:hypothetical protein